MQKEKKKRKEKEQRDKGKKSILRVTTSVQKELNMANTSAELP